jgi:hypothetical protein
MGPCTSKNCRAKKIGEVLTHNWGLFWAEQIQPEWVPTVPIPLCVKNYKQVLIEKER